MNLKISLLQILPTATVAGNLSKGVLCCRMAKALGADVALFPEMWSIGYRIYDRPPEVWIREAIPENDRFITTFGELAGELEMAIGITFLEKGSDKPLNSIIVFDHLGKEVIHYSKVHTCGFDLEKVLASAFQSVTTRTAGFASVSQSGLTESSRLLGCILMFIGGSPAGTAGGIKTTTFAMLILTIISVLRGHKDTECFGRRVDMDSVRSALTITLITFTCWLTAVAAMSIFDPQTEFLNLMYEASSAIGTVGLSADLTPHLTRASHVVLMLLMYIGRIGPLTMAIVFAGKSNKSDKFRELPEKKIMLG